MTTLRIGTRGSQLALWQAQSVAGLLKAAGVQSELVIIKTTGDRIQNAPLAESGGKRLFVKEIEDALIAGEIDLAVHSAKDMPAALAEGLALAAALPRDDPRDALVISSGAQNGPTDLGALREALGAGQKVGTSSIRRTAQLRSLFPRVAFAPLRGNVDTRLRKLDEGGYDALVLAAAGLRRLGFGSRITTLLPVEHCVPAPGQGIIAIETRADDRNTQCLVEPLNDARAAISLRAERALVAALGGGCQLPLGGLALHDSGGLEMHAVVASPDGRRMLKRRARGLIADAELLGQRIADELTRDGAGEILDAVRKES